MRPKDTNGDERVINILRTFSTPRTFSRLRLRYTALNTNIQLIVGIIGNGNMYPWQWPTPEGAAPPPPTPNDLMPGTNKLADMTFDTLTNVTSLFIKVISKAPNRFDPGFWLHDLELF